MALTLLNSTFVAKSEFLKKILERFLKILLLVVALACMQPREGKIGMEEGQIGMEEGPGSSRFGLSML